MVYTVIFLTSRKVNLNAEILKIGKLEFGRLFLQEIIIYDLFIDIEVHSFQFE